jgi:3-methylfumaryl-CoA hydratase
MVNRMNVDMENLRQWIGRTESLSDVVTPVPITALAATLDIDTSFDRLPPLWHWLYFLPVHRWSDLGPDGHPKRGGFLPPVPLPRRMWAGGRVEFHHPLRIGESITRTSTIVNVQFKEGRTGPLVFVLVRHEIRNSQGVALTEEHDIVYRELSAAGAGTTALAPDDAVWQRVIRPDDVLLFRYSALTFNGHRIHYDRRYATEVEGYPGLVVHGPLIATLLVDLVRSNLPQAKVMRFEFRAVSPLFDTEPFIVCGKPESDGRTIRLWAENSGGLAMTATAVISLQDV